MTGRLTAICTSKTKGIAKSAVPSAELLAGSGLAGDAHAGSWHRQVSLLDAADVQTMKEKIPRLKPGAFGENLVIAGLAIADVGLGSVLQVGSAARLRISQIGKICHDRCAIYELAGDCIMPRCGLFARVIAGGSVQDGDPVELLHHVDRETIQAVVLTISDRCSRGEADDTAGPAVAELLQSQLAAHVYAAEILPDEQPQIAERLRHYSDGHSIDLVITAGGTGLAPRDITPEATAEVIDRPVPGMAEAMRAASLAKTPHAMLSRALCGVRRQTLIVNLPGSRRAATECLAVILPALGHGLRLLRGEPADCGRVPRQAEGT